MVNTNILKLYLHSTMYLLKQPALKVIDYLGNDLHSTMYLLKLEG